MIETDENSKLTKEEGTDDSKITSSARQARSLEKTEQDS
jgi:hypothetical protein